MELKTKVTAEDNRQEILVSREFDLPNELLFKAYAEPELVEQWMSTKVVKLESKPHGSFRFETRDPEGNLVFSANGTIHEFQENKKITRTFEMENSPFPVQLEFLEFEEVTENTSKLIIHIVFRSIAFRDQLLSLPFASGLNKAHNRLEEIFSKSNGPK